MRWDGGVQGGNHLMATAGNRKYLDVHGSSEFCRFVNNYKNPPGQLLQRFN